MFEYAFLRPDPGHTPIHKDPKPYRQRLADAISLKGEREKETKAPLPNKKWCTQKDNYHCHSLTM